MTLTELPLPPLSALPPKLSAAATPSLPLRVMLVAAVAAATTDALCEDAVGILSCRADGTLAVHHNVAAAAACGSLAANANRSRAAQPNGASKGESAIATPAAHALGEDAVRGAAMRGDIAHAGNDHRAAIA